MPRFERLAAQITSFSIASALIACTVTPQDNQRLKVNGGPVLFAGYSDERGGALTIQVKDWKNDKWVALDSVTASEKEEVDECGKRWYWWERYVTLPPVGVNYWRPAGGLGLGPISFSIQARVIKQSSGNPLFSFKSGAACSPTRNCGDVVASECGKPNGLIWLWCAGGLGETPEYCGQ